MTNVYQENQGNGHHVAEAENSEIAVASNKDISDLSTTEQQLKLCRQMFSGIANVMQQAKDTYSLTSIATHGIREKLECDRTLIYRFDSVDSGVVVAESRASSWTPAKDEILPGILFGFETNQEYVEPAVLQVNNQAEITPYQAQLLEKYQVKSSLTVPILFKDEIWGLLVVQSCSAIRQWQEIEINLLSQIAVELNYKFQSFEFEKHLQQQAQEQKTVVKVINRIRQSLDLDTIFKNTTKEVRQLLQCDRVSVYRFNSDWSGEYIGESVAPGWTPLVGKDIKTVWEDTHLQETEGGRYARSESFAVNDIYQMNHSQCHLDLLEQFEVKAYVLVPVFVGQKLWGLLAAYQNSGVREWQEREINLLAQIAVQFGIGVSQAEKLEQEQQKSLQLTQLAEKEKALTKVVNRIRQSSDVDTIFKTTTREVRELLQCDRVGVYRFNPDWSGEFIAESLGSGWTPLFEKDFDAEQLSDVSDCSVRRLAKAKKVQDTYLQETQGGRYPDKQSYVVDDIYKAGFPQCYLELLEQFEAKAYMTVPIFKGQELWGLLATYQNSGSRHWEESELSWLNQIALQFGVAISQAEYIQQVQEQSQKLTRTAERQQSLIELTRKIGETLTEAVTDSSQFDKILQTTVTEVRQLLQADRSVVYRFNSDWSGDFVAESMGKGLLPFREKYLDKALLQQNGHCDTLQNLASFHKNRDKHLQENQGGRYKQKSIFVVNDVEKAGFPPCYMELLEQFEAKAYLTVPIFKENKLWGLLATYQNNVVRKWEEFEITSMQQIAVLLGVAMQQAETVAQLQLQSQGMAKTAELDRATANVVDKIRQLKDTESIFSTTTKEVRTLLETDRVAIYRFNPDWGGVFVSESVAQGWISLVEKQERIPRLQENIINCTGVQALFTSNQKPHSKQVNDTYLQANKGGELRDRKAYVRSDIHNSGFTDCYVEVLDQYQAKAYAIVPIFQGQKLWGMLAAFENRGTREWEQLEVSLLSRIADQLGIALQQAEYLQQLEQKTQEVQRTAELDRAVANVVEKIRESLEMQDVFTSATKELRSLLKVDRSVIYRFNSDWSGEFVAESVGSGWVRLLNLVSADTNLRETQGGRYAKREYSAVPDIYTTGFDSCHLELLEQYQARAYIIVPIFQGQKLWGLLAVYQNSSPRQWEDTDITLLTKISDQLGVALQQAEFLQQLQAQSLQVVEAGAREKEAKEYLQKGAMKLLSAVRPALDGDLTVRAPLSEDELGTIADAYNNTLQALRQIVVQVQAAAQQVADKSDQSNASLSGLTTLAQQQSKEMDEALEEVQEMVDSTQAVVCNAELVQAVVEEANHTVELGDGAMNRTVEAIQGIRETVAQTSKKIKRLSESSQKISKVVSLISNFATQTNVLALNAAIEATRAGEYGKGFAVVADEVRSLSRQSAAATIEIEKLVQEIQEETGEVSVAMETGIQQVVEGTALVNETRMSLNAIVTATAEISKLLQQITDATQGQMLQSVSVTASMKDVAKIANKTSTEASNIAIVFQELSETAQELLASASKFKVN